MIHLRHGEADRRAGDGAGGAAARTRDRGGRLQHGRCYIIL